ncbi:MAG: hypothetical protein IKJ98_03420 [Bacteroidales bacterium]|nr:hypothetical protein [Bacteroidales bacterium]
MVGCHSLFGRICNPTVTNTSIFCLQQQKICSISFGGERNGTQRKAADGPARLKINVVH